MNTRKLVLGLGIALYTSMTSPVSAHTVLVSQQPSINSVLQSLPSQISLTFAEELIQIGKSNSINLIDESGKDLTIGEVEVSGTNLTKNVIVADATGIFKVVYRAVAADGHVVKGEYTFNVAPNKEESSEVATNNSQMNVAAPIEDADSGLSIYFILSATSIVGGALILIFIWKKQSK